MERFLWQLKKTADMKKIYPIFLAFSFSACHTARLDYIGSRQTPTRHVEIFVDEKAISRHYLIIGKGYEVPGWGGLLNREKMLARAVEKARKNGADAVFYRDQFIPSPGTQINTQSRTDSVGKAMVTSSSSSVNPVYGYWHHEILFLKYQ
jgi:hypothetical protein